MRTEVVPKGNDNEKMSGKSIEEQKIGRGTRRSLQVLQQEAGDKENLVGGGRMTKGMTPTKTLPLEAHKKAKTPKIGEPSKITLEDLTEEDPGAAYWEALAEKRRLALEEALRENESLHQRVALLEEENEQCKTLLDETRALVETLTEILNSGDDQDEMVEDED